MRTRFAMLARARAAHRASRDRPSHASRECQQAAFHCRRRCPRCQLQLRCRERRFVPCVQAWPHVFFSSLLQAAPSSTLNSTAANSAAAIHPKPTDAVQPADGVKPTDAASSSVASSAPAASESTAAHQSSSAGPAHPLETMLETHSHVDATNAVATPGVAPPSAVPAVAVPPPLRASSLRTPGGARPQGASPRRSISLAFSEDGSDAFLSSDTDVSQKKQKKQNSKKNSPSLRMARTPSCHQIPM